MTTADEDWLLNAEPRDLRWFTGGLKPEQRNEYDYTFSTTAHDGQLPPPGEWRTWLIMAGRGFGKTRAGAEWVRSLADADPEARIALVAATLGEARSVMVEGESGLLACCPPHNRPSYEPSLRKVTFPNGAMALLYGANEPESLRGPQHSHSWCDEIGKWSDSHWRASKAWDNLPETIKNKISGRTVTDLLGAIAEAMLEETFDELDDRALVWDKVLLDKQGWDEIEAIYRQAIFQTLKAAAEAEERVKESGDEAMLASWAFLFFKSPFKEPDADA